MLQGMLFQAMAPFKNLNVRKDENKFYSNFFNGIDLNDAT
jgi:hypothetical protein